MDTVSISPTLLTERLILRPFTEEDAPDVFAYAKDEETVRYLTWPAHKAESESLWAIRTFYQIPGVWAICKKEDGRCIGCIELRFKEDSVDFGYVLRKDRWGQGIMTEALSAVLGEAFGHFGVKKVIGGHECGNNASGAVMRKCGMRWVAHRDAVQVMEHRRADMEYYEITDGTWKASYRNGRRATGGQEQAINPDIPVAAPGQDISV